MKYENETHRMYGEALQRVINNNIKPTNSSVAFEAGKDRSSIKPDSRPWMDGLIDIIDKARTAWIKKNKGKEKEHRSKVKKRDSKITELEYDLNESLARELLLIRKVRNLELEIVDLRSSRPTLADLSSNLPDWTKMDE